jgi:hypothetical protein
LFRNYAPPKIPITAPRKFIFPIPSTPYSPKVATAARRFSTLAIEKESFMPHQAGPSSAVGKTVSSANATAHHHHRSEKLIVNDERLENHYFFWHHRASTA